MFLTYLFPIQFLSTFSFVFMEMSFFWHDTRLIIVKGILYRVHFSSFWWKCAFALQKCDLVNVCWVFYILYAPQNFCSNSLFSCFFLCVSGWLSYVLRVPNFMIISSWVFYLFRLCVVSYSFQFCFWIGNFFLLTNFFSFYFVLQERKEGGKRGRKPGRKASSEKIDMKAKLGKYWQIYYF